MLLPNAVDEDPRGQRIVNTTDPLGQCGPPTGGDDLPRGPAGSDWLVSGPTDILPDHNGDAEEGSVNSQVPSSLKVNENESPGAIAPLSKVPSSAVTL